MGFRTDLYLQIKSGVKEFWCFDGPAQIRLDLGYAITDNTVITFGRSNQNRNFDLNLKQWLFQTDSQVLPIVASIVVGGAWNADVPEVDSGDKKSFQFFTQMIFNSMIYKKLGLGVVPSYLYNSHIQCEDTQCFMHYLNK